MHRLSADESELWRRVVRDVAPLQRHRKRPEPPRPARQPVAGRGPPARSASETPAVRPAAPVRSAPLRLPPLDRYAGIDRATAERLRRGRYPLAGRLDLHGMTQDEAHRALSGFVVASRLAGRRCLLVITGNGRLSGGVLKAAVPRWLAEPRMRMHVLAIAPARPQHGGAGALYVLLRRLPD